MVTSESDLEQRVTALEKIAAEAIKCAKEAQLSARQFPETVLSFNQTNNSRAARQADLASERQAFNLNEFQKLTDFINQQAETVEKMLADLTRKVTDCEFHIRNLQSDFRAFSKPQNKWLSSRLAIDKQLDRKVKAVTFDLAEVRDRLSVIEATAFPDIAGALAKVIGKPKATDGDNPLDRRKHKPRH